MKHGAKVKKTSNKRVAHHPQPSAAEQQAIIRAKARCDARGPRVKAGLSYDPATGGIALDNPHSDYAGWGARLRDALGTCSGAFVSGEIGRIAVFLRGSDGTVSPQGWREA